MQRLETRWINILCMIFIQHGLAGGKQCQVITHSCMQVSMYEEENEKKRCSV